MMLRRRELLSAGAGAIAMAAIPGLTACAVAGVRREGFFASHGQPIGLQLYTLGQDAVKQDLEGTLKRVAAIGYRAIELPGLRPGGAAEMRAAADSAGVAITGVHVSSDPAMRKQALTVHDDVKTIAAELRALGCRDVVLPFPLLPEIKPEAGKDPMTAMRQAFRTTTEHWKRTADLLNARGAALQREGLTLSYHNHNMEFLRVGETSGWDILVAETNPELVSFEVDVGWVVAGGLEPEHFIETLGSRMRALHVKDLHAPDLTGEALKMDSTEVGSGIIDWKKVLPAAYRAGVRQFYVEQEPPFHMDRFEAVAKSYDYLSRL